MRGLCSLFGAVFLAFAANATSAQTLLIDNITIIDVEAGEAHSGTDVLIDKDRILAVAPTQTLDGALDVARDVRRIDGSGLYLIPGLWDMHGHTSSDHITRKLVFPVYIAHGVTGIRDLKGDCIEPCWELSTPIEAARAREADIARGELVGPRVVAGSAFANGASARGSLPTQTPEDARAFVRTAAQRGVAFIKPYDSLPRDAYHALVDEARIHGIPVAGHLPVAVPMDEALVAGQRSIEHLGGGNILDACSSREDELRARTVAEIDDAEADLRPIIAALIESVDWDKCDRQIARLAASETWVTPTLVLNRYPGELGMGEWHSQPQGTYLHPSDREYWEADDAAFAQEQGSLEQRRRYNAVVRDIARRMHAGGVKFLTGSDAGVPDSFWGQSLHLEMQMFVSIGMSPAEALRSATLAPARFLGRTADFGTVAQGRFADLVLLYRNPLKTIENTLAIAGVISRGHYLDRTDLDAMLGEARAFVARETERLTSEP